MLFKGKERMEATLLDIKPKLKRAKQGKDGEKLKFIDMHFEAKLTTGLRGKLSARLQPIVAPRDETVSQTDSAINKVDLAVPSMEGVVRLFGYQTFKKDAKPKMTLGGKNQPRVHIGFAGIFFREGDAFLDIHISSQFTEDVWAWAGDHFGEAERDITLEIEPEKDLFEEAEETEKKEPEQPKK